MVWAGVILLCCGIILCADSGGLGMAMARPSEFLTDHLPNISLFCGLCDEGTGCRVRRVDV